MELLFDTANLEAIRKYAQCYPITGVTGNPSILKSEGNVPFFEHLKEIRTIIGQGKTLHVQVTADDCEGILREADAILTNVDEKVYIKIPVTEEGLKAMQALKARRVNVTATAIYTMIQGFTAILAGADYIAPYVNRMENLDVNAMDTISAFRTMIDENGASTKILAASFKNISQVNQAFLAGAHTATVQPAMLHEALSAAAISKAVDDFKSDWTAVRGDVSIDQL